MRIPIYRQFVSASGFESPADDYVEDTLSLDELLIQHPAATYMVWAKGSCQEAIGIFDGDLLVVDRALRPRHGDVVVALLDGELTCKVLDLKHNRLLATSPNQTAIVIPDELDVCIEGVIPFSIRAHRGWPCLP